VFCPAGHTQPPPPSGTNPVLQVKPQAPAVHEGVEFGGNVQATHPGPQAAGVSAEHVVAPAQAFWPEGQTQPPAPFDTKP
jgi:hypothetical protein